MDWRVYDFLQVNMPQFVTKVSRAEMEAESKKATQEGLRQVASALNTVKNEEFYESDSDNDYMFERKRYRQDNTESLENRIHFMKLDMTNMSVDLINRTEELEKANKTLNLFKAINNDLEYISKLNFYLNGINELTVEQLEKKLKLFLEEDSEHAMICMKNISQLELPEIKGALTLSLKYKRLKNKAIEDDLKYAIKKKQVLIMAQIGTTFSLVVLIIALIVVQLIPKN